MVIPLGDDDAHNKSPPFVTWGLIAVNILIFLLELAGGEEFVMKWAFIPSHFIANPVSEFPTIFTSMFMHAGWAHLGGNMLYLWIFGGNVEDTYGKIPFLIFYIVCGVAATFAQLFFNADSSLPNIGASGAIAGVLGAYILLFPQDRIRVLIGRGITQLPALIVIGFWFILQFISGIGSLSSTSEEGGVAYMAHIGGFAAGFLIAIGFNAFYKRT